MNSAMEQTEQVASVRAKGMVTSPHHLASEQGLRVLQEGGNAIEAAITMGASLAVLYPHFTGFGGDSFMIIADREGRATTLSGIGQAAADLPDYSEAIPTRGPQSMLTTAATVDTLGRAHDISCADYGGKLSWQDILAPAIRYASDGFPLSDSQKFWYEFRDSELKDMPGVVAGFGPKGSDHLQDGQLVYQPELAASLKLLAANGYRDFYEGELAQQISRGLQAVGSPLTLADLGKTHAREQSPLSVPYRDGHLIAHQPPTQGVTTLEIMGILNQLDFSAVEEGSTEYYHLLLEAIKRAFIDRNRCLADPDFAEVPVSQLLNPDYLQAQAESIDAQQALPWPHTYQHGDTVFMAATDAQGVSVALLQTIYYDWGSGMMAGDTGILWHNRGAAFNLMPGHPNQLKPGKRPFHTLNPGMYLQNGKPSLIYGTQGADGQPQTLAVILTRLIDYQLSPKTALERPRFLLGRTFSDSRDSLKLEADAGAAVFSGLQALGHEVTALPAQSPLAGQPGVIKIDPKADVISGAHDPRSDGCALPLV